MTSSTKNQKWKAFVASLANVPEPDEPMLAVRNVPPQMIEAIARRNAAQREAEQIATEQRGILANRGILAAALRVLDKHKAPQIIAPAPRPTGAIFKIELDEFLSPLIEGAKTPKHDYSWRANLSELQIGSGRIERKLALSVERKGPTLPVDDTYASTRAPVRSLHAESRFDELDRAFQQEFLVC